MVQVAFGQAGQVEIGEHEPGEPGSEAKRDEDLGLAESGNAGFMRTRSVAGFVSLSVVSGCLRAGCVGRARGARR